MGRPTRILLIDGPAVLGWERWRELQAVALQGMVYTLRLLTDQSVIANGAPELLAQLNLAALNEAALSIGHASAPTDALAAHAEALLGLVRGLRIELGK
jgi:hypothetical protein